MLKIINKCPSCGSDLTRIKDQLYCIAKTLCPAQNSKRVEHYCKVLSIKGLGPRTVERLGWSDITDIYFTPHGELVRVLGQALGEKANKEIQDATNRATLADTLEAFSIPLIGGGKAGKVAELVSDINQIEFRLDELESAIGPKALANLLEWYMEVYPQYVDVLPDSMWKASSKSGATEVVCITGKLINYTNRREAASVLEQKGYKVTSGVTKATDFLVNEFGEVSAKSKQAQQYGIPQVKMEDLIRRKFTHE